MDMLAGLVLRHVLRYPLILLWTSAAQRRHSWITRFYYRHMDAIIATTRKAAGFLERPATVVYHGVDVRAYHPPADRTAERDLRSLPGRRNLGIFGRIRPQKGSGDLVDALVRVLPRFPDWGAVIVGAATPEHQGYERRSQGAVACRGTGGSSTVHRVHRRFRCHPGLVSQSGPGGVRLA